MDYIKHYNALTYRAKCRILEGYTEKHHIIPKCVGGDDSVENIIILTPEEHYLAHLLLVKIYPGRGKLIYAAKMMTVGGHNHQRSNKLYAWLRKKHAEAVGNTHRNKIVSSETRLKQSISKKQTHRSVETLQKLSRPKSKEHRRKNGERMRGTVACVDLLTGITKRVPKSEFNSNENLVGVRNSLTKGIENQHFSG